jgi:hypothetical protein
MSTKIHGVVGSPRISIARGTGHLGICCIYCVWRIVIPRVEVVPLFGKSRVFYDLLGWTIVVFSTHVLLDVWMSIIRLTSLVILGARGK